MMETDEVTTMNLNYRIELITDMSIELLEACDLMDKGRLRDSAIKLKNHFFGIWFRTKAMLKRYSNLAHNTDILDKYISNILNKKESLEIYRLLEMWSIYCDLLNESGITEMPLTTPTKQYAKTPEDG